jgi:vacuolar iron transporter family protein
VQRASRYQRRLAKEQGAASVYQALAQRREGEEREILLALARAEERHAAHWAAKLHPSERRPRPPKLCARMLGWLASRLRLLVVLGMVQRAEAAGDYERDLEATAAMAADEQAHALVVAGLAQRARARASGWFRAAVFGANDGLVSNFSLVLGMAGADSSNQVILLSGLAGLLAGALSMAAAVVVGVALFATGTTVGLLTGGPLLRRGLRQLGIGAAAAVVTYGLGRVFGTTIG